MEQSEIVEAIANLESEDSLFRFAPGQDKIKSIEGSHQFTPEDFTIVKTNRYEGTKGGDDEMVSLRSATIRE